MLNLYSASEIKLEFLVVGNAGADFILRRLRRHQRQPERFAGVIFPARIVESRPAADQRSGYIA
jgi:hypothetical protein